MSDTEEKPVEEMEADEAGEEEAEAPAGPAEPISVNAAVQVGGARVVVGPSNTSYNVLLHFQWICGLEHHTKIEKAP